MVEVQIYKLPSSLQVSQLSSFWLHIVYNSLFRLARKYLSVQATSTPAERVMSAMGIILEKRQRMMGDLFNEIMFLSDII